jgi:effector-binding domain-containing protein
MLGSAYGAVMQYLAEMREQPSGPPFAMYYNMEMENLDVEAGFPVAKAFPGRGEVKASELPAGPVATCLHLGPYQQLTAAYSALTQWVVEHGYEPTGVTYEVYLNDPQTTPPEALQTQIVFVLRQK